MIMPWIAVLASQGASVELAILNPRCVNDSNSSINAISALVDRGRLEVTSSGFSVLERGGTYILPEADVARHSLPTAIVRGAAELSREVLDPALPVLISPFEVMFQWPRSRFDWLATVRSVTRESATHDVELSKGVLVRLRSGDSTAIALELSGTSTLSSDPLDFQRMYVAVAQLSAPDDEATFYAIGRPLGAGPRVAHELGAWRAAHPGGLLIHSGAAIDPWVPPEQQERCASSLHALGPAAIVPRAHELGLGLTKLTELAKKHELPYVAANLESATVTDPSGEASRLFPRFRLFRSPSADGGELITAVIGVVDPKALSALTAAARANYRARDVGPTLAETKDAIFTQLGRYPDFTIVLVGAEGPRALELAERAHVDLVIGDFPKGDAVPVVEQFRIPPGARERARYPFPLARLRGGDFAVSFVSARFGGAGQLTELTHELRPILDEGAQVATEFRSVRELEEKILSRQERVVLPDVAPIVERAPALLPLVYGERVPNRGGFRKIERPSPIRLTDELWMRLVTSAMLDELDADVALSRCPNRTSDMIGPISQMFIDNWIRIADTIAVVDVTGATLLAIGEVISGQRDRSQDSSADWIYAGGFDADQGMVRGRPIDPRARYRVALTDEVAGRSEISKALRDGSASSRFSQIDAGWVEEEGGQELALRDVVQRHLDRWSSKDSGFLSSFEPEVAEALADRSKALEPRWQLRIDDVSMSGSRYEASKRSELFAETRETRLTTPDNLSIAGKLDVALTYDGPLLAFETRAQAVLDRVLIEIPGVDIPAQEQADDLVVFSELRLLAVSLGSGGNGIPITPFLRATFDSEITPTPDPEGGSFPHQRILRGALGLFARPGKILREVRLGALLQEDLSGDPHQDFGLTFGYSLYWPIFDSLAFESRLDGRWLARDSDDVARDLSVYVQWPNRLKLPFARDFAAFLMADAVIARGKVDPTRVVAGSLIFGAGLSFSRVFEL